jgi:hypothetical protein
VGVYVQRVTSSLIYRRRPSAVLRVLLPTKILCVVVDVDVEVAERLYLQEEKAVGGEKRRK